MWWPSFISILGDLGRFLFRIEPQTEVINRRESKSVLGVTLDNHDHAPKPRWVATLHTNVRYDKNHEITKLVRTYLKNETALPVHGGDLTPFEWFAYYFSINNRAVPWQRLGQNTIGFWHQVLKGLPHISIGIEPKSNAILEWQDNGVGKVGNVTKVTPRGDITIQELGGEMPGVLSEKVLSLDTWRELRPVFISVT